MNPFDPTPLLAGLRAELDIDVLIGRHPGRDEPELDAAAADHTRAAVASLRAALFDVASGNDEVLSMKDAIAVGALDLRDPVGALGELDRLAGAGVTAVRFFPDEQGIEPDFPGLRHVAKTAAALGMTLLTGGDVRRFWRPFAGLPAAVVFLDTHFYHLGDFLLAAADEPGFHSSTRLLTSPDALETAVARIGPRRLLFGSRTPVYEPLVPLLRLATSELSAADKDLIAGGNARRLLEPT